MIDIMVLTILCFVLPQLFILLASTWYSIWSKFLKTIQNRTRKIVTTGLLVQFYCECLTWIFNYRFRDYGNHSQPNTVFIEQANKSFPTNFLGFIISNCNNILRIHNIQQLFTIYKSTDINSNGNGNTIKPTNGSRPGWF